MATAVYGFTGALQHFDVPADTHVLAVEVTGAAGCPTVSYDVGAGTPLAGGRGARVRMQLEVIPGERLWIAVAAASSGTTATGNGSPLAGGGRSGGGAASIVGRGLVDLDPAHALLVAGGGGGGGEDGAGGDAGGIGARSAGTGGGGLGGGQDPTYTTSAGEDVATTGSDGCAGGGGGVLGGRAGTVADGKRGGGGGGSSRVPAGATVTSDSTGAGSVVITYGLPPLAATAVTPAAGDVVTAGRPLVLRHAFHGAVASDQQAEATYTVTTPAGTFERHLDGTTSTVTLPAVAAQPGPASWTVTTRAVGTVPGPSTTTAFTIAAAPVAPVITSPGPDETLPSAQAVLTWTAAEQAAYRLRRTDLTGTVVYEDTLVTDPTARTLTRTLTANHRDERWELSVRSASGAESDPDVVIRRPRWTAPATPQVTVTPEPATASLRIEVTHPVQVGRPAVVATELQVQAVDLDGGMRTEPRHEVTVDVDGQGVTRWRLPAHGVRYLVVATGVDALGVPAVGTSDPGLGGWGVSPWGAGPWGS